MSKAKTIFVGVLAVCAFGAVASAAQAAHYVVEGTAVSAENKIKHVEELGTTNTLKGTPFGVSTEIKCTHRVILEASINTGGAGKAKIEFSSCTVAKPTGCTVTEPITIKVNTALEEPSAGVYEDKFESESGPFTEITLAGSTCSLKGSPFPVEGTQTCSLPGAGTEAVTHELTCSTTGSKLTAGGKVATFSSSAATLELESSKKWSVAEGVLVEAFVEMEEALVDDMLADNPFNREAEVAVEPVANPGKGAITNVGSCKKGNKVAKGGSCAFKQERPVGAKVGFR